MQARWELALCKLNTVQRNLQIKCALFRYHLEHSLAQRSSTKSQILHTSATTKYSENLANPTTFSNTFLFFAKKFVPVTSSKGLVSLKYCWFPVLSRYDSQIISLGSASR